MDELDFQFHFWNSRGPRRRDDPRPGEGTFNSIFGIHVARYIAKLIDGVIGFQFHFWNSCTDVEVDVHARDKVPFNSIFGILGLGEGLRHDRRPVLSIPFLEFIPSHTQTPSKQLAFQFHFWNSGVQAAGAASDLAKAHAFNSIFGIHRWDVVAKKLIDVILSIPFLEFL